MTENKRFKRYLLDGGFWFDEYVKPIWSINDTQNKENPISFIEFKDEYKDLCDDIVDELNNFHEENQSFKKENMEYYHIINCGNCKYHNWDWYDDGDEFEVCEKGNNERLMYHRFCKEWRRD